MSVIKKLPQEVINRIAAGECVQHPVNAVKELLENSFDAGANKIQMKVKGGGLEMFQIKDNGSGIKMEDFELVCQRHTTSKLEKVEDLLTIQSFGFRGEALASISYVAFVNITSKTPESQIAYCADYLDGKVVGDIKASAGETGTTIKYENLFHNSKTRLQAQRKSEEYNRICRLIQYYALHKSGVSISLKKVTSKNETVEIHTREKATKRQNIRNLFGREIARELCECEVDDEKLKFKAEIMFTNPNWSNPKAPFIIFVNNRYVVSKPLKKHVLSVFEPYLPEKKKPFVYLSLLVDSKTLDVNMHPAKEEVRFLHEDEITDILKDKIKGKLLNSNNSRVYFAEQSKLSFQATEVVKPSTNEPEVSRHDRAKVRSTISDQTGAIEKYVQAPQSIARFEPEPRKNVRNPSPLHASQLEVEEIQEPAQKRRKITPEIPSPNTSPRENDNSEMEINEILLKECKSDCNSELKEVLSNHVWVGFVRPSLCLIQHQTKLFCLNPYPLSQNITYQTVLQKLQKLPKYSFSEPISIFQMLKAACSEKIRLDRMSSLLVQETQRQILNCVFSIEITEDGKLLSLPKIFNNYIPPLHRLPTFLLGLGESVVWTRPRDCIQGICKLLSDFYALSKDHEVATFESFPTQESVFGQHDQSAPSQNGRCTMKTVSWTAQHVFLELSRKKDYFPSRNLVQETKIQQLADTIQLYKIFERC